MVRPFKIATWNVNSLRVRLPHLLDWLAHQQPDWVALQETKILDEHFPVQAFQTLGYHALFSGQKTYNGVALLSRFPNQEVVRRLPGLEDDPQRRIIIATYGNLKVVNVYVPNGEAVGSDKYYYKINWLQHLFSYLKEKVVRSPPPYWIVLGDFNIAPKDEDIHHPFIQSGDLLVSAPERAALKNLYSLGLYDTFRLFEQAPKSFSWWDYRGGAFQRNHGARIDLILVSTPLLCVSCMIDKVPRSLERPSDHAPVVATFSPAIPLF